jgi:rhomboid protease GluP
VFIRRQKTGAVICSSCGKLVGAQDEVCYNCGRRNPGMWGFSLALRRLGNDLGFVPIVIGACGALYVAALVMDPSNIGMRLPMNILSPSGDSLLLLGMSGAVPVFDYQRWWTVLSAGWLHGSLIHITFNMMWLRQLASTTAELYGAPRMVIIYVVASVTGFLLSSTVGLFFGAIPIIGGAAYTVGASAAIFGLLGALVYYGRRGGSSYIGNEARGYAVILFIFGFFMPGIDNYAHLGGFLGGYAMSKWLDPLEPERVDHLVAALGLLVLSALSIVASVVHGLSFS